MANYLRMQVYTAREPFLAALATRLEALEGAADIAFGKSSPGAIPADGRIIGAIHRNVTRGGRFVMVVRDGPDVSGWLEPLAARFADMPRARIVRLPARRGLDVPALTIDTSDVFLHLTWAVDDMALPYSGVHLHGSAEVAVLAEALRGALHTLAEGAAQ